MLYVLHQQVTHGEAVNHTIIVNLELVTRTYACLPKHDPRHALRLVGLRDEVRPQHAE
jgi:hypothetical protein